jgi:hypothetical protein
VSAVVKGALANDAYAQKVLKAMTAGATMDYYDAETNRPRWIEIWETDKAGFRPFPYHRVHWHREQMWPYETLMEREAESD